MKRTPAYYCAIALCLLSRGVNRPNTLLLEAALRTIDAHCERLLAIAWGEGDPGGPEPEEFIDAIRDIKRTLYRSQREDAINARVNAYAIDEWREKTFSGSGPRSPSYAIRRTSVRGQL